MSDARKIAELDALFASTMTELRSRATPKTYKIDDVIPGVSGRELTLEGLHKVGDTISHFAMAQGWHPFCNGGASSISMLVVSKFISGLREFTVSDKLRKELSRGIVHKSKANKMKVIDYHANKVARAHACLLYRQFVTEFAELVLAQDVAWVAKQNMLSWASSSFRCEGCGVGEGKHRRPGLDIESRIKALSPQ